MHIGYRFVLIRDVDRFPDFVARAGATGVVTDCGDDLWGLIDQHIEGAGHWDNQLHWASVEEFLADTAAHG